uniref:glucan endo-1,3-beta-D-glucosidase n=1 Tax=Salix viminalis TaxID=40686 RepID=A0A6N2MAN5_SALVM
MRHYMYKLYTASFPSLHASVIATTSPSALKFSPPENPNSFLFTDLHRESKQFAYMRGRSYSPSPPRGYGRRGRSPSPRGRYGGHSRDLPTSLLVRNLRHDCRPEDLRRPFEQFGALKDIYLPRDYYTGEPRGFGFVQYADPHDAAEAKHHMDGRVLLGRELTVVFAEENRKKPVDMRSRERPRGRFRDRRRSPPCYSRSPRHSRSPPPRHARSRSRSREYYSPPLKRRHHSRSASPQGGRYSQERPYSRSRSRSQTPNRGQSRSPVRSRSRSPVRSRSRSPKHVEYPREANGDRSPRAFVGINIGTDVSNMPSAPEVVAILKANQITHLRLYDADAHMLKALADSGIEVMVGITNEEVLGIGESPSKAAAWINQNVAAYLPSTNITSIAVGSEVLTTIPNLVPVLVPAMNYLHKALVASNLNFMVKVSTPQAMDIIPRPFPPSTATFNSSWSATVYQILQFLKNTDSYYMLNAYPYFGYTSGNGIFPLDYALFRSLPSVKQIVDPNTLSHYDSMFDALVDATYYSIEALNMSGIPIVVTETGWPWLGGANEPDATADNAETFNSNLIRRVLNDSGPPSQPKVPINTYIYELFNEDKRPGPVSEKNWGLFFTNGSAVYTFSLSTTDQITGNNSDFCVAKPNADPGKLQAGLDWACGQGGASCNAIQEGQPCYLPNTYQNHASYAYNDYYQKKRSVGATCDFDGTAATTTVDPGHGSCKYTGSSNITPNSIGGFTTTVAPGPVTLQGGSGTMNLQVSEIQSLISAFLALTPSSIQFCILLSDSSNAEDHYLTENDYKCMMYTD